jgi:hypothetical protein
MNLRRKKRAQQEEKVERLGEEAFPAVEALHPQLVEGNAAQPAKGRSPQKVLRYIQNERWGISQSPAVISITATSA